MAEPSHSQQLDLIGIVTVLRDSGGREVARFEWPPWFTRGKNTPSTHAANVARGRHPFGAKLGPEDSTCGACYHAILTDRPYLGRVVERRLKYKKCALAKRTCGSATDLRVKWRGCMYFKRGVGGAS